MFDQRLTGSSRTTVGINREVAPPNEGVTAASNHADANEDDNQGEEDSSELFSFDYNKEIVMSIDLFGGKLGCSVLDYHTKTLQVFDQDYAVNKSTIISHDLIDEANKHANDINLITGLLIMEMNPSICLVPVRLEDWIFDYIKTKCDEIKCRLELQPIKCFKQWNLLRSLQLNGHNNRTTLNDLLSNSRFSTSVTVGTVACILANYEQHAELEENNDSTVSSNMITGRPLRSSFEDVVHDIRYIDIKDRMVLDENTVSALNIFPAVHELGHDNMMKNGSLSVFELFNLVSSDYARRMLKSWLFNPLTSKRQIEKRYYIIRILLERQNTIIFEDLSQAIKKCPDAFGFINQLRSGRSTLGTWSKIVKFLEKGIAIFRIISSLRLNSEDENLFQEIKNNVDISVLKQCLRNIETVIDFDTSRDTKAVTVNTGVDRRLDECRNIYNHLEGILLDVAREAQTFLLDALPQNVSGITKDLDKLINAVYIPQLGYLVTVSTSMEAYLNNIPDLEWEEIFRSPENVYFKNSRVFELDETYGDIYGAISDFEIELLFSLQEQVLEKRAQFTAYSILLSELEILVSFAQVSAQRNYTEPQLVENDCVLEIINGRHALYETFLSDYIPNSTMIDGGLFTDSSWCKHNKERVIIITGANASGKSVYLTQNGLIVYLAQIGCFVPAERAKIGIVDKILTRIRTQETIYKTQSSFILDSQQMAKSLTLATERSLILIDEYGKGTDILDGPSLFGSIMLNMSKTERCPRILACTHFHELFNENILTEQIQGIKHYCTDILINQNHNILGTTQAKENNENEGITFLFRIKEGISKQSFGIYCAKICGLKKNIVERAEELSNLINSGGDVVQRCGKLTEDEISEFQKNQEIVKRFLSWDLDLETSTTSENLRLKLKNIIR
ncbi:msh5p [Saccharomyces arboricola H-6]|uniref:Msh5p n=1 Tax=Saccharomyces arboricola (strain H-6 / AS 2.3317 / CBS 10644) TaxID=1160507 RepID=J8Q403_SACAR|nr:msh5p [Saccharomyces arboricola H-6]